MSDEFDRNPKMPFILTSISSLMFRKNAAFWKFSQDLRENTCKKEKYATAPNIPEYGFSPTLAFSCVRRESKILFLYGKIQVRETPRIPAHFTQ